MTLRSNGGRQICIPLPTKNQKRLLIRAIKAERPLVTEEGKKKRKKYAHQNAQRVVPKAI